MTRGVALAVVMWVVLAGPPPVDAYLHLSVESNGETFPLRWTSSRARWFASNTGVAGVSPGEFQATIARAMQTWESVPTARIAFDYAGTTSALPFEDDDLSVFGFLDEPDLERVLGATSFVVDVVTGELVEADVFFNSAFAWSTTAAGDPASFDLQSTATHEVGHFIGLGHSAIGETELRPDGGRRVLASAAVMFPISFGRGNTADRTLQPDDIAAVSDLYPDGDFRARTGVARGRVLHDGRAAFGAHVVAFNPATGASIAGFAIGEGGEFQIAGLTPGAHVIRVEPLDDGDVESFFSAEGIDLDFQVTFHPRLFVAPAGGVGERFDVRVRSR